MRLRASGFLKGGLILALVLGLTHLDIPSAYRPLVRVLAEGMAILILLLAWRYRRGRLAIASFLLAAANYTIRQFAPGGIGTWPHSGFTLFACFLLLNLGILFLIPDRPLFDRRSLLLAAFLGLQILGAVQLLSLPGFQSVNPQGIRALLETSEVLDLLFLLVLLCGLLAALLRKGSFEISMLWITAAIYLLLKFPGEPSTSHLLLLGGQTLLLLSVIEDSYHLAFIDPLTGLAGRRALDETLNSLGGKFALAMVDIDHFKKFNDRWGHESGDQALRMVARKLRDVGGGGQAYRYGGEEFTIVFPGLETGEAAPHLENLRKELAGSRFGIRQTKRPGTKKTAGGKGSPQAQVRITVSIGVAGPTRSRNTTRDILKASDKALYRAKKNGRNRLVQAPQS